MSARRIIVELQDANGSPVKAAKVKATDCWELESNDAGLAVFLIDVPDFAIAVDGNEVYQDKLDSAPEKVLLVKSGNTWKAK